MLENHQLVWRAESTMQHYCENMCEVNDIVKYRLKNKSQQLNRFVASILFGYVTNQRIIESNF